jgi:hypothetical protein
MGPTPTQTVGSSSPQGQRRARALLLHLPTTMARGGSFAPNRLRPDTSCRALDAEADGERRRP